MGLSSTSCRIPAENLTIGHQSSPCFCETMAKDINEQQEKQIGGERTIRTRMVFENIILVSKKTVSPGEVKYLQINIQKLPKERNVTEETSERLYPINIEDSEVRFDLGVGKSSFDFRLTKEVDENAGQYEIELEVMRKTELSRVGSFDVRLSDLDTSEKTKWRKICPVHKWLQTIEIRFGVFAIPAPNEKRTNSGNVISVKELRDTILEDNNPFEMSKLENNPVEMSKIENKDEKTDKSDMRNDITTPTPRFRSGSCIMVGIKESKFKSFFKNDSSFSDVNCAFTRTGSRNHRQRKDNDNEPVHREQGELFGKRGSTIRIRSRLLLEAWPTA